MTEMASVSARVAAALRRFCRLEWFKLAAEVHPFYSYQQLPYLAWRYAAPNGGVAVIFRTAAREIPQNVEWVFDSTVRNWSLSPARLVCRKDESNSTWFQEALQEITEDQDFCVAALADLELMVRYLADVEVPPGVMG
uniref:Uncharacterized protein n=1 Tax=Streptomyces sp. NBC_00003 TaxID=2903608 RepID=A0AAU2V4L4_9ACTN